MQLYLTLITFTIGIPHLMQFPNEPLVPPQLGHSSTIEKQQNPIRSKASEGSSSNPYSTILPLIYSHICILDFPSSTIVQITVTSPSLKNHCNYAALETESLFTGKVKYVSGNGSFSNVKCHHSSSNGLNPCLIMTSLKSIRLAYCSSVIPV